MASKKQPIYETRTAEFRASFVHVLKPKDPKTDKDGNTSKDARPTYELVMVFPKDATTMVDVKGDGVMVEKPAIWPVERIVNRAARFHFGEDKDEWPGDLSLSNPSDSFWPIKDADARRKVTVGHEGCWTVRAWTYDEILVGHMHRKPNYFITEEKEFYAGCYAMAKVHSFGRTGNSNPGVSLGLDSIIFTKDGEKFGRSTSNPNDDFADLRKLAEAAPADDGFGDDAGSEFD